ncbi:NADPH-dependent FMN reductase [Pseudoalteromonas luteoviolacea]|uniref:Putative flavoprotein n=1 Tax=Pseudoalteromonas luteoviolacea (strain 2ta16) TaxID=1353533 RepID=V4I2A9_PSEL2|nr:NAD(P)H-dependent oxidoreductase [Pseudoalteromonas luteoviolacea]ESP94334.1 putative flavoprotein [Pseudoalteromonas luteoviolacea 2ta16]KZN36124.1 NADPH-dependent FMN reductase [Pseudoalteromonas luteoviolacea NCIMB 1944]
MKVLAFAASNSRQSINNALVKYAASQIENAEIEILDLNDFEMPIYSIDREKDNGIPEQAQKFYDKIGAADAVIVSFAEHNGSYTAAYKNIFDWTSRIDMKVYQNTPMVLLATSPGPGGAQSVLGAAVNSAPYFAADVKAHLSVPSFFDNFDMEAGKLTNGEINDALSNALKQLTN